MRRIIFTAVLLAVACVSGVPHEREPVVLKLKLNDRVIEVRGVADLAAFYDAIQPEEGEVLEVYAGL